MTSNLKTIVYNESPLTCANYTSPEGDPAGGSVMSCGMDITWQKGPRGVKGQTKLDPPNGAFVEDAIGAAIQRLEFFQGSSYRCRENALAITKLHEALMWLTKRARDRELRGVLGKNEV